MIKIKLKELLERYDITISDLSDATGISRSTITPLVNSPEQVKGLNLDTIDTLCDFFGIKIDELLDFVQTDTKYVLYSHWYTSDFNNYTFLFRKKIGKRERYSFVKISVGGFSIQGKPFERGIILNTETTFLSKKETKDFLNEINTDIDINSFPEKNIFENDFSNQPDEHIKIVTKLLSNQITKNLAEIEKNIKTNHFNAKIEYIKFNWNFTSKKTNNIKKYIYDIESKDVIDLDEKDYSGSIEDNKMYKN